jgi:septal ring factor EnvC (AmiA/AmiB activator)
MQIMSNDSLQVNNEQIIIDRIKGLEKLTEKTDNFLKLEAQYRKDYSTEIASEAQVKRAEKAEKLAITNEELKASVTEQQTELSEASQLEYNNKIEEKIQRIDESLHSLSERNEEIKARLAELKAELTNLNHQRVEGYTDSFIDISTEINEKNDLMVIDKTISSENRNLSE